MAVVAILYIGKLGDNNGRNSLAQLSTRLLYHIYNACQKEILIIKDVVDFGQSLFWINFHRI